MGIAEAELDRILAEFAKLETALNDAGAEDRAQFGRDYAALAPKAEAAKALKDAHEELRTNTALAEAPDTDADIAALAREECTLLSARITELEAAFTRASDEGKGEDGAVDTNKREEIILEIRAGTGGEEAALFAQDLLRMYRRYAVRQKWKSEILSLSDSETGGVREAVVSLGGRGVFARMRFESGVHRVQRVPTTESSGRIHTSAASVAVLHAPDSREIEIAPKDIRWDVFRASGPGGQSVNTTDSAVRATHVPTGIIVIQQDEKSQHRNRARALQILRARLFDQKRAEEEASRAAERRGQIGTGDRSERIRTYNFPQGRVSDHRISLTLHKLTKILDGDALDEVIDALISAEGGET